MATTLTFLGAAGTVTGSKYLLEAGRKKFLIDCGLFQGFRELRLRNWSPLPIDPKKIDAIVLTHAHLDHSGYLPLLVRGGFRGPVYCTSGTHDLCSILLPDSGHLQEADARFANRRGFSKHRPALPLYTQAEAEASLQYMTPVAFGAEQALGEGATVRLFPAGHILGAAHVSVTTEAGSFLFSGDLGRPGSPTMVDPSVVKHADYLVVESTYGNREHAPSDPESLLADVIGRTAVRGGVLLVPAFAVGRAHTLLFYIARLKASKRIPDVPVFLDSPMAVNASQIYCDHIGEHRLTKDQCHQTCRVAHYVRDAEESKELDRKAGPMIIISASGMLEGGRVLHHLKAFGPKPQNTVLFTGYQAGGTRGAALVGGAKEIKIHGDYVPINAEVISLDMLSAHADWREILGWLRNFETPPRRTFITHGEPEAAQALRARIEAALGWPCRVPQYLEKESFP